MRSSCDYLPFVEPGVDVSISSFKDPETCKRPINRAEDWIEILGAGMVHPKVLESARLRPQIYTGFSFGMGPERITMLKHGIEDIPWRQWLHKAGSPRSHPGCPARRTRRRVRPASQ